MSRTAMICLLYLALLGGWSATHSYWFLAASVIVGIAVIWIGARSMAD